MKRRDFISTMGLLGTSMMLPLPSYSAPIDTSQVNFSSSIYSGNNAQTIMIFLYGGPSELGGNLTNFDQIQQESKNKYNTYYLEKTENNFWKQAGGDAMERMLASGDMNIFRTCFRKAHSVKAHGICTAENQRGIMNQEDPSAAAGIFSSLAYILKAKGVIDENTILPFLTMEGASDLFSEADLALDSYLKAVAVNEHLDNPYARYLYYDMFTSEEWNSEPRTNSPIFDQMIDTLSKSVNKPGKLKDNFEKRASLEAFIENIKTKDIPTGIEYPENSFADKLKTAVKILVNNPDTKVISLGSGGLGGWDDHNDALRRYTERLNNLMTAIETSIAHMKAENKNNINIIVFGEFGRNVNLNDALGWDHGNNQNVWIFGGQNYFNNIGIAGETQLQPTGSFHRMYLEPTSESYWFEPYSAASTIYKMYGITNPEILTGGYPAIDAGLFKN